MKTAAWAASIGLVAAVPVLYKTPERLAALYAGAAAAYFVLKPLAPSVDVEELDPNRRSLTTDRFSEDKIPEDIDTVVIGSGMSGLSCASILARSGKKVLVLEQHDRTGGGSHEYELGKENYRFDAGLHYTVPESGLLLQLCTGTQDQPVRMDPLGEPKGKDGTVVYERVYVGEGEPMFEVKMHQKHMGELRRRFPDNQADIDCYIREAAEAVDSVPLYVFSRLMPRSWQRFFAPVLLRTWNKQAGRTIQDALNNITQNKKLQAYFSSLWLDTGCPPERASWMLGAAVFYGLSQKGGAYPRGGAQMMSACLVPVVERYGGRVLCRASVQEIVVEDGKVVGVKVEGAKKMIKAKTVISSAGYRNTYGRFVNKQVTTKFQIPRTLPVDDSCGFVMVNMGFRGSAKELGFTCTNSWYIPTIEGNMFASLAEHWKDPTDVQHIPMMFTFPSMKDHALQQGTKHTCQVLIMVESKWFEQYKNSDFGKRPEAYDALKKKFSDAVVYRTEEIFPGVKGKLDFVDCSTPLTIEHYLKTPSGGAGGLDQTPFRFTDVEIQDLLDTRSKIPGLWLTGQDSLLLGIPLVQLAGIVTALRHLGFLRSLRFVLQNVFFAVGGK